MLLSNHVVKRMILVLLLVLAPAPEASAKSVVSRRYHGNSDSDCSFTGVVVAQQTGVCFAQEIILDDATDYGIERYLQADCSGVPQPVVQREYGFCANLESQRDDQEYNNPHVKFLYHKSWKDLEESIIPGTYAVRNFYDPTVLLLEDSTDNAAAADCPSGHEVARYYYALDVCLQGLNLYSSPFSSTSALECPSNRLDDEKYLHYDGKCLQGRETIYEIDQDTITMKECAGHGRSPLVFPYQECQSISTSGRGGLYSKWTIVEIKRKTGQEEFRESVSGFWDDNGSIVIGVLAGIAGLVVLILVGCFVKSRLG
mmetsp:Transcript_17377/g.22838  ORF Transcript_17377/g.22838 Transcript_17377/m.22838 type:complete len:314 (+) Transcript_17377:9-950(+)